MQRCIMLCLSLALALSLGACTSGEKTAKREAIDMASEQGITKTDDASIEKVLSSTFLTGDEAEAITELSLKVLRDAASNSKGGNSLVSGLSIVQALGMAQNGAAGNTLEEMESSLGIKKDALNKYFYQYRKSLEGTEKTNLFFANSLWVRDREGLQVERDFLQTMLDFYGAELYKAAFNENTIKEINSWVKEHTEGMIEEILNQISQDAVIYLINALYFIDDWEDTYAANDVFEGDFMQEDYTLQEVDFMFSKEYLYLEDGGITGMMKPYKNKRYYFVALLPEQETKMKNFLDTLSGERLRSIIENASELTVHSYLPKFRAESSFELSDFFKSLGMQDAFDMQKANFSAMGSSDRGNLFFSAIVHKTYIELNEQGTRAAAVTAIETKDGAAREEIKIVKLERPFVYLIYDAKQKVPVFVGCLMKVEGEK